MAEDVEALASEGDLRLDDYRALAGRLGLGDLPEADVRDVVRGCRLVFGEVLGELSGVADRKEQELLPVLGRALAVGGAAMESSCHSP